ncbi:MAG: hypothetical protein CM15mP60_0020 [Alphaproteobacteria bacterium]|nr:MAG: hypothetical protein CM15mP60_0020 [Alphaproteobacteria bacterium]
MRMGRGPYEEQLRESNYRLKKRGAGLGLFKIRRPAHKPFCFWGLSIGKNDHLLYGETPIIGEKPDTINQKTTRMPGLLMIPKPSEINGEAYPEDVIASFGIR